QLRSVKLQAAKAQRYQEYSQRLQELRVALGLQEYHQLTGQLQAETAVLDGLRAGLAERAALVEAGEADTRRLEEVLTELDAPGQPHEAELAGARQQIATQETILGHEQPQSANLEADLAKSRLSLTPLNAHVATLAANATQAAEELHRVESQCQEQRQ